jgi:hypothetical protein
VLRAEEQRALRGAVVARHAAEVVVRGHGVVRRGVPNRPCRKTWYAAGRPAGGECGGGGVSRIQSTVVGIRPRVGLVGGLVRTFTCVRR